MYNKFWLKRTVFDAISFGFLILVLAFVIAKPDEGQLLKLEQNFNYSLIAILIGGVISHLLNTLNLKTLGELLFEPPHKKTNNVDKIWYKTFYSWQLIVSFVVTFAVAVYTTQFSFLELLDIDGFEGAKRIFKGLADPNFAILNRAVMAIFTTIFIAFLATVLATPIAFVLSFFAARNLMQGPLAYTVYLFFRTLFNIIRSIEALIWAIIFSVWVGIGPFAGMLALMIHSIASLTKQYSEIVESVSDGPIEGIESTGANKIQVVWFAIVPQVLLPFISFTVYRWDINVRMATLIGMVGGGGIGTMLMNYQGQAMYRELGCIIVVIAIVVWIMDQASASIREALK